MKSADANGSVIWRQFLFALRIAGRYLFSRKSHNAINVISGISSFGVAIGTMALVVVLSVFNGFESLVKDLFSELDPALKIVPSEGKSFFLNDTLLDVTKMDGILHFSEIVEDNVLIRYKDNQMPARIKGIPRTYVKSIHSDSLMFDGEFTVYDGTFERSVPGVGIAAKMGLGANFIDPLYIYAPRRHSRINLLRPEQSFNQAATFLSGIFTVNQAEYDNQFVFVSIDLARELLEYASDEVSSIEIQVAPGADAEKVLKTIQDHLGPDYKVLDRYQQQTSFFNIMQIEKWMTYLILSFILLIASFNIIGSLSMLIIDKKNDIQTLRSLGADKRLIRRIFLFEGWMISVTGAFSGVILGTIISLVQEKFKIVELGAGYVVDAYPVLTQASDIVLVVITVLIMGFLAAWYPIRYMKRI